MHIPVRCDSCGRGLKAPAHAVGRKTKCPACGAEIVIPRSTVAKADAVPSAVGSPPNGAYTVDPESPTEHESAFPSINLDGAPEPPPLPDDSPLSALGLDDEPVATGPLPPRAKAPVAPLDAPEDAIDSGRPVPARRIPPRPPEPWCYWFIEIYALLCMVLGVGQLALSFLLVIINDGPGRSATATPSLGWSALLAFGSILFAAPIFLAVDAARNIREMRFEARER